MTACHYYGQEMTIDHIFLECIVLQKSDDNHTADSLKTLFETIPEACVVFLREAGPRLNIKTVLSTYGVFHVKDKTAVRTSYL